MIKSLYSGVTGIRAHQTKMDVIGNNIANVNTTAFKSSRVTFKDVYYQTISNATSNTENKGGMNAKQIGFGTAVSTIDVINTRGGIQSTDRTMDLYLSGEGYFIVADGSGAVNYTRAGNLGFDVRGGLVDANGNYVAGWQPTQGGMGNITPLIIPNIHDYTNISIGADGLITGVYSGAVSAHTPNKIENLFNLSGLEIDGYTNLKFENGKIFGDSILTGETNLELFSDIKINNDLSITAYDFINGTDKQVIGKVSDFIENPADYTEFMVTPEGNVAALYKGHFTNTYEVFGSIDGPSLSISGYTNVSFANGTITGIDETSGSETVIYTNVMMSDGGIFFGNNEVTGVEGESISALNLNDLVADLSVYSELAFNPEDGTISGLYIAGQVPEHIVNDIEVLGQIGIAMFSNPDGLIQKDGIYFQESRNSGNPKIVVPGDDGSATIISGGLEMSNVDLSKEFTDMITTQRGFQANSRLITTSDQLLEELINLKR